MAVSPLRQRRQCLRAPVTEPLKPFLLKPGDTLRFRLTDEGILLDKAIEAGDPFAAFSEWTSEADEKAFADL